MERMDFLGVYTHDLSPFLWQWGDTPWGIRYYSLAYVLGFIAFYGGMMWFYKKNWSPLNPHQISDLMVWAISGVLIGGRLGYCLVYDLPQTLRDPVSIIAFWRGGISGMASHGGMLGAGLALWLYAKWEKVNFWVLADHTAILTPIGIFFGRIANFINGELWGRPVENRNLPWAVIFPQAGLEPRHPSQLYEALGEGVVLFAVLLFLRWKGWTNGKVAIAFLVLYALVRIILEGFREPDRQLGFLWSGLTMGQTLSVGLLILAGVLEGVRRRQVAKQKI